MDALPSGAISRITLLWLGRLGDVLVATPVMAAIRRKFPSARITLITGEGGAAAAQLCPDIDETLVLRRYYRPLANLDLTARLLREEADLLIDLNTAFSRSAATLTRLARARAKWGFRKGRGDGAFTFLLDAASEKEHMLDRYGRLAGALGAPYEPNLRVRVREQDLAEVESLLRGLGARSGRRLAAVFPGNFKKFDNRWPEEKFAELTGRMMHSARLSPFFLAGPGEKDAVRAIVSRLQRPVPILGPLPIGITAGLLSRVGIFIGNCTGTTHLAIAVGTPTFSLLSRYTATVWMPRPSGAAPHFCAVSDSWDSCRDIPVDAAYASLEQGLDRLAQS